MELNSLTTSTQFISPVHESIIAVEALMRAQAAGYHPDLTAALELLLSSGGKRIRPAITLLVGRLLGAENERLVTLASAIELLHTATLVHDDLIDGSLLRRGMPTLNSQWSPGATILTGDFLFASAAKLASQTNSIPVMSLFSKTLSVIVNGEIDQLFANRCFPNIDDYLRRIHDKTASLFEMSAESAALISPVNDDTVTAMRQYGYSIGMAFQIVDDILDFTGEQTVIGKPVGSDLRQGLITLPVLHFIKNDPEHNLSKMLRAGDCPKNDAQILELVLMVRQSGAIKSSLQTAREYAARGIEHLSAVPDHPEKFHLQELAEFIVSRDL